MCRFHRQNSPADGFGINSAAVAALAAMSAVLWPTITDARIVDQIRPQNEKPVVLAVRPAKFDRDALAHYEAHSFKPCRNAVTKVEELMLRRDAEEAARHASAQRAAMQPRRQCDPISHNLPNALASPRSASPTTACRDPH